jgi:hypothetical protein
MWPLHESTARIRQHLDVHGCEESHTPAGCCPSPACTKRSTRKSVKMSKNVGTKIDHVLVALKDAGFDDMVSAVALQVNGKEGTSALKFMAVIFALVQCGACDTLLSAFKDQQSEKKRIATGWCGRLYEAKRCFLPTRNALFARCFTLIHRRLLGQRRRRR